MYTVDTTPQRGLRRGFSLIEIMAVMAIIATLALVVVPYIQRTINSARTSALQTRLKRVQMAIETYRSKRNVYPDTLNKLLDPNLRLDIEEADLVDTFNASGEFFQYKKEKYVDTKVEPNKTRRYVLYSVGPDEVFDPNDPGAISAWED